jgi:hypothetical protein
MKRTLTALSMLLLGSPAFTQGKKDDRARATGPEGHVLFSQTLGGGFFVPKDIMKEYEKLQSQLDQIKTKLEDGSISGREAVAQTEKLRKSLTETRDKLEKAKVRVSAASVHRVEEAVTFDPCPDQLLVVTADRVTVVGTDDPKVTVKLEKIFLSTDGKPAEKELEKIKLIRNRANDPEVVGRSKEQRDADEVQFRAQQQGKPLTEEAMKFRREIIESNVRHHLPFEGFQGKVFDHVSIQGLTFQEGNRQIAIELRNDDQSGSFSSVWQRHASMTVYVPKGQLLAVRGARRGLEIRDLQGSVVVTSDGSHDRDYEATFSIKGVKGNVSAVNFPMNRIEEVQGDVTLDAPADFANSGTLHQNDERYFHYFKPNECTVRDISGRLRMRVGRVSLKLEKIQGGCDVGNLHGDTTCTITDRLPEKLFRLHSVSGAVRVDAEAGTFDALPVLIGSNYGTIRTNTRREQFEDFSYGVGGAESRDWHGFRHTPQGAAKNRVGEIFEATDWLSGRENPKNGLIVTTEAGAIQFRVVGKKG